MLALAGMVQSVAAKQRSTATSPHFAATAKNIIFCFMDGGPSHVDTFDPKPELKKTRRSGDWKRGSVATVSKCRRPGMAGKSLEV